MSGASERPGDDDPSAVFQARLHAILTAVIGRLEQLSDEVLDAGPADDGRGSATSQAEDAVAVPDGTPGR